MANLKFERAKKIREPKDLADYRLSSERLSLIHLALKNYLGMMFANVSTQCILTNTQCILTKNVRAVLIVPFDIREREDIQRKCESEFSTIPT